MVTSQINVLINDARWAWPVALNDIFTPCGVDLLLAQGPNEALTILEQRRVHTAILDMDSEKLNGLATVRLIRGRFPLLPCILVSDSAERRLLSDALGLEVFSVISKPVNMCLLQKQLNTLFLKKYKSEVFSI